ncbi:transcriptional regulator [Sphingomonas sp. Leaf17]|uniref:Crp/Fnr family transcriptional regulator n=1 Tax=Sphingomonas sp. Leaf17 TaxID=1735683 RepID=UPI0006FD1498|nr:Crp/Fnr family transcriptional regulator [Sphingomonas sp. Leaf17]KQM67579.1 transcriptional regulator [Sphingomonas sp. Leaf17]
MPQSLFADRLSDLIALTPDEIAVLTAMESQERPLRRGSLLVREKDSSSDLFILRQGMMISYVLLDDGSRQILRFVFPGDMAGISALVYRDSPETIVASTDCVVAAFDRATIATIISDHPRLAAVMLAAVQVERVAMTDRLASLGRTSAKARVAALLVELRDRMRRSDRTMTNSYTLGLTQEEIGDAIGLTAVHVNRMLRQLEEDGLIARHQGRITLLDEQALSAVGFYTNRFINLDLSWMPPPR